MKENPINSQERKLIDIFRKLSEDGKDTILVCAEAVEASELKNPIKKRKEGKTA